MKNLVILDFGSNSTRLAVYTRQPTGEWRETLRKKQMTRLAAGMGTTHQLQPEAIERVMTAVRAYQQEYTQLADYRVVAIATAAVRNATNSEALIAPVKEQTGCTIRVLSGEEEARYDFLGVINTLGVRDFVMCDMGGGSFELAVGANRQLLGCASVPWGAVSLSERFGLRDHVAGQQLAQLQRLLSTQLNQFRWLQQGFGKPLVLIGGTNRAVTRYELADMSASNQQLHGVTVAPATVLNLYEQWLGVGIGERRQLLGAEGDRADIILGGLTPVVQLIEQLCPAKVIFSESGVREGLLVELTADAAKKENGK